MSKLDEARAVIGDCDREMAVLFEKRMAAVRGVAAYKAENQLPVFDAARENELLDANLSRLADPALTPYYAAFQKAVMGASRKYQHKLLGDLYISLPGGGYDIRIGRGLLFRAGKELRLDRRVLIVTDSGVPSQYARSVLEQCTHPVLATVPMGEGSKSMFNCQKLCEIMLTNGFDRGDCVVAVGGGVCGDLAAFAASAYMRGIDFYNIPTTLLSQVDSSVGGKCGVNLNGIKNCVGAFKQPAKVLIDPDVLSTLPPRQFAAGLAEVIKMAATSDAALFARMENEPIDANIETIIDAALRIKRAVVEEDERESGLRRVLNFGHTVGHGIESCAKGNLAHGECVALGMLPMCAPAVRARLTALLKRAGLPVDFPFTTDEIWGAVCHDKKAHGDTITYVWVEEIGTYEFRTLPQTDYYQLVKEGIGR